MTTAEKMILADALATAIDEEREIRKMKRKHNFDILFLLLFALGDIAMMILLVIMFFGG